MIKLSIHRLLAIYIEHVINYLESDPSAHGAYGKAKAGGKLSILLNHIQASETFSTSVEVRENHRFDPLKDVINRLQKKRDGFSFELAFKFYKDLSMGEHISSLETFKAIPQYYDLVIAELSAFLASPDWGKKHGRHLVTTADLVALAKAEAGFCKYNPDFKIASYLSSPCAYDPQNTVELAEEIQLTLTDHARKTITAPAKIPQHEQMQRILSSATDFLAYKKMGRLPSALHQSPLIKTDRLLWEKFIGYFYLNDPNELFSSAAFLSRCTTSASSTHRKIPDDTAIRRFLDSAETKKVRAISRMTAENKQMHSALLTATHEKTLKPFFDLLSRYLDEKHVTVGSSYLYFVLDAIYQGIAPENKWLLKHPNQNKLAILADLKQRLGLDSTASATATQRTSQTSTSNAIIVTGNDGIDSNNTQQMYAFALEKMNEIIENHPEANAILTQQNPLFDTDTFTDLSDFHRDLHYTVHPRAENQPSSHFPYTKSQFLDEFFSWIEDLGPLLRKLKQSATMQQRPEEESTIVTYSTYSMGQQ